MFGSYIFLCTFVKYKIRREMTTTQLKSRALDILVNIYGLNVTKNQFSVKQAKQVIAEYNFKLENNLINNN